MPRVLSHLLKDLQRKQTVCDLVAVGQRAQDAEVTGRRPMPHAAPIREPERDRLVTQILQKVE